MASLLFDSLRGVVRERHTLKGAGVRVTAVAGVALRPPRSNAGSFRGAQAGAGAWTRDAPAAHPASASADGDFSDDGGRGGDGSPPQPPHTVPTEVIDAVGSGVISVSTSGHAAVEHLGRGGGGGGINVGGVGDDDAARRAAAAPASAAPQQVSLWRLRAARRRRQARGNKMRALVGWAAGEDVVTASSWSGGGGGSGGGDGDRGRERGGMNPAARGGSGGSGGKLVGRSGALVGGDGVRTQQQQQQLVDPGFAGEGYHRGEGGLGGGAQPQQETDAEQPGGGQARGWGSALQARALALPASLLPKRT